jgi:hypothetical protein
MAVEKLDRAKWRGFFDHMSKAIVGKRAEIEVASLALGDQIEVEWLPVLGVTYDHKDNIIVIALEGLDHPIDNPSEVYVDQGPGGLANLEIIDAKDTRQIVKLRDPLMLPPSASSSAAAG